MRLPSPGRHRRGAALMAALVALSVFAVMLSTLVVQMVANQKMLDRRQAQLQAHWLARSGWEIGASRVLAEPPQEGEETRELIENGTVRVEVRKEPDSPDLFRITSEARFGADGPGSVVQSVSRRCRRTVDKDGIHIVPEPSP